MSLNKQECQRRSDATWVSGHTRDVDGSEVRVEGHCRVMD